jgi:NTE family protein
MGKSINSLELKDADIVIRPPLAGVSSADFSARKRAIDAGREAAMAAMVALRQRVLALTH